MARRQSSETDDPFDFSFDDIETADLDDLRVDVDDVPMDIRDSFDAPASRPRSRRSGGGRAPLRIGALVVGAIQVILTTVIALAIFLAIGFGIVYLGQQTGVIPPRGSASAVETTQNDNPSTQVAAAPTQPANAEVPVAPQTAPTDPPAVVAEPTATTDPGCPSAASWWNSQQIQDSYTYFTQRAISEARGSNRVPALLQQMQIRRDYVANVPGDPCVEALRAALLSQFDAISDTVRVINTADSSTMAQHEASMAQANAGLTAALWAVEVGADENSPPALGIARGSGASCGAQAWYDTVKAHRESFLSFASQIDLETMPPNTVRGLLTNLQVERNNLGAVTVPDCATQAQQHLLSAFDNDIQWIEARLAGNNPQALLDEYNRQDSLFMAWVAWLDVR